MVPTPPPSTNSTSDERLRQAFAKYDGPRRRKHVAQRRAAKLFRVVGGTEISSGQVPYLVAIFDFLEGTESPVYRCSGSLIAPDLVLSAAHCFHASKAVVIGRTNLFVPTNNDEYFRIVKKKQHPDWGGLIVATNDLALFQLSGKSKFGPVKLNSDVDSPFQDEFVNVMGWGVTQEYSMNHSAIPFEAKLQYKTNEECQKRYEGKEEITDDMMCAWSDGSDACKGDSGGPLVLKGADSTEDVLVGSVSWGYSCADPYLPGVYSRIAHSIDWIIETACTMSPSSCSQLSLIKPSQQPSTAPSMAPIMAPTEFPSSPPTSDIDLDMWSDSDNIQKISSLGTSTSSRVSMARSCHLFQLFAFFFILRRAF